ncbi:MAG TPA: nucleoside hydrolase [Armatimonadota bacterium]|nr:nucleoside hydrolase [Armatimonadota bacterium]
MGHWLIPLLCPALIAGAPTWSSTGGKVKVILDTDIGGDIDDAFCLALAIVCPEVELIGVTTSQGPTEAKARIACRMLHLAGRDDVPVAVGRSSPSDYYPQCKWGEGFTAKIPIGQPAADFIIEHVRQAPGEVVLVVVGPETNIMDALAKDPGIAPMVRGIATMAGSAYVGYNLKPPPDPEFNIKMDVPAAQAMFTSGIPIRMAGLDITAMMRLEADQRAVLFSQKTPLTDALEELYRLWGNETPILYDPVALAWAFDRRFFGVKRSHIEVDAEGYTRVVGGLRPNAEVGVRPDARAFMRFYVDRIVTGCRNRALRR